MYKDDYLTHEESICPTTVTLLSSQTNVILTEKTILKNNFIL